MLLARLPEYPVSWEFQPSAALPIHTVPLPICWQLPLSALAMVGWSFWMLAYSSLSAWCIGLGTWDGLVLDKEETSDRCQAVGSGLGCGSENWLLCWVRLWAAEPASKNVLSISMTAENLNDLVPAGALATAMWPSSDPLSIWYGKRLPSREP